MRPSSGRSGQTLVETALVLPLFLMVVMGIIVLGIGVFYQQQLSNTAREAARYAAIHSATAQCPTVPRLPYQPLSNPPLSYSRCDRPEAGWPFMTGAARGVVSGMTPGAIQFAACWSGYRLAGGTGAWDAPPPGEYDIAGVPTTFTEAESVFVQCHIDGRDPTVDTSGIPCQSGLPTTDQASAASEAPGRPVANTVTIYACYQWQPPMSGFLLIPNQVTLRAVVTEAIERQQ
ncbi:MAG: pilus assembly protein [Chloroflexi bacterium]|nr:pilus assembly protein [Chloroflexota bacterium]